MNNIIEITDVEVTEGLIENSNNLDAYNGAVAKALSLSGCFCCRVTAHNLRFRTQSQATGNYSYNIYTFSRELRQWMRKIMDGKEVNPIKIKLNHAEQYAYI